MPDIWFPYLGIKIQHLSKYAFTIGDFSIAWYGIIVAAAVVAGLLMARHLAKKSDQNPDLYTDFLIYALIFGIIGARAYYVAFEWDNYSGNLLKILDLRGGGLAIYGGVIAAIITALIFCKIKHYSVLELLDTAMPGLVLGQAIGRWGNFFNQEAFGSYTDGLFAMRLNKNTAAYTTSELLKHTTKVGGVTYIQVHPTFLYESFGCLCILILMLIIFRHKKFKGQVAFIYMICYGVLRAFIENLRTDQLLLWNTNFPISVFTSIAMATIGFILMLVFGIRAHVSRKRALNKDISNAYAPVLDEEETDAIPGLSAESSSEAADAETAADNEDAPENSIENDSEPSGQENTSEETSVSSSENDPSEKEDSDKPTDDDLWG